MTALYKQQFVSNIQQRLLNQHIRARIHMYVKTWQNLKLRISVVMLCCSSNQAKCMLHMPASGIHNAKASKQEHNPADKSQEHIMAIAAL